MQSIDMRDQPTHTQEDAELIDVRGPLPRWQIDVLDAIVQATPGESRINLLRQIVGQWCERELHKASLLRRVTRGNGSGRES